MKALTDIAALVVHHSASPLTTSLSDIRVWHMDKGWDDIGYHWVINSRGQLLVGRPMVWMGAHCLGFNDITVGLCVVGDNTKKSSGWTPPQVATLHRFWQSFHTLLPAADVGGHRDYTDTECPGLDVRAMLLGPNAGPPVPL